MSVFDGDRVCSLFLVYVGGGFYYLRSLLSVFLTAAHWLRSLLSVFLTAAHWLRILLSFF